MEKIKEKIEKAASKYSDELRSCPVNDYNGFVKGAEWAFKTGVIIDGPSLTKDILRLKELHLSIFSGGQFTESDAKEYEDMVNKYEGLDLMKIF